VAFAATAGPKRREALAAGARQKKSGSRLLSAETRWRTCEVAFAATAGPKCREALAAGARQKKSGSRLLSAETRWRGLRGGFRRRRRTEASRGASDWS
jgi:uncharacterized membrane protein